MKICFVVPRVYVYFNTKIKNNAGGAERQVYYLGTELSKNKEFDDIIRSFVLAGVPEQDVATDISLASTLYKACVKYGTDEEAPH